VTAAITAAAVYVPTTGAPSGAPLPSPSSPPRIAFRSVLLGEDVSAPQQPGPRSPSLPFPLVASHPVGTLAAHVGRPQGAEGASGMPRERRAHPDEDDPLDPMRRHRAADLPQGLLVCPAALEPAGSVAMGTSNAATTSARMGASLEDLVPALVRRIAWSGDRHRGAVRIELGAGELAGGTLLVQADDGRVRVHLDAPPGADPRRWQERITERLATRGLITDSVEVT